MGFKVESDVVGEVVHEPSDLFGEKKKADLFGEVIHEPSPFEGKFSPAVVPPPYFSKVKMSTLLFYKKCIDTFFPLSMPPKYTTQESLY